MAAVAAALAAAGALSGCGSGGGSSGAAPRRDAARAIVAAYRATARAGTAHFVLSEHTSGTKQASTAGRPAVALHATGVVDFASSSFRASVVATTGSTSASGGTQRSSADVVQSGTTAYLRLTPEPSAALTKGRPWISIHLNRASMVEAGRALAGAAAASAASPTFALGELSVPPDSARRVAGQAGGARPVEYRVTVGLHPVEARARAKLGKRMWAAVREEALALGDETVVAHVWVAHGRVQRIREEVPVGLTNAGGSNGAGDRAVATISFSNFGEPASVVAPSGGQVTDITPMVVQRARHAGT